MSLVVPLAQLLRRSAPTLAVHWRERALAAVPRAEGAGRGRQRDPHEAPELALERGERLVAAVAGALLAGAVPFDEPRTAAAGEGGAEPGAGGADVLTLAGWEYGVGAFAEGRTLPQLLQEFDLLAAILLHEAERACVADGGAALPPAEPAAAFRAARRMQEMMTLATVAALSGFAQELVVARRAQLRALRHDLRNPLATIQNVVALMDDDAMPIEARRDPRYTAMLSRNAATLGAMITDELRDPGSLLSADAVRVPVEGVALAVRRSLRTALVAAGVDLQVEPGLPRAAADPTALALALRSLVAAALREVPTGTRLHILPDDTPDRPHVDLDSGETTPANGRLRLRLRFAAPVASAPSAVDPDAGEPGDGSTATLVAPQASRTAGALPPAFADAAEIVARLGGRLEHAPGVVTLVLPISIEASSPAA